MQYVFILHTKTISTILNLFLSAAARSSTESTQLGEMRGISKQLCDTNSFQYLKYNQFAILLLHGTRTIKCGRARSARFLLNYVVLLAGIAFLSMFSVTFPHFFDSGKFQARNLLKDFIAFNCRVSFELSVSRCNSIECSDRSALWVCKMGAKSVVNSYQTPTE